MLRFEAEGRVIEVRGFRASAIWGSKHPLRYPPGEPEKGRAISNLGRYWFFLIARGGGWFLRRKACKKNESP